MTKLNIEGHSVKFNKNSVSLDYETYFALLHCSKALTKILDYSETSYGMYHTNNDVASVSVLDVECVLSL